MRSESDEKYNNNINDVIKTYKKKGGGMNMIQRFSQTKNIFLVIALGFLFLLVGCSDSSSTKEEAEQSKVAEIKEKGKIVIATGNYFPFEYHDQKLNKLVGYDIDLGERIAEELGVEVEWSEMQFQTLIPSLQNNQADLAIAAMYMTDERKEVVDFAEPYLSTGQVLVKLKGDTSINSVDDLEGKTIGVKSGATSEKTANDLKAQGVDLEIKSYKETIDYLTDLELGRVDAVFNDYLNQLGYFQTKPDSKAEIVGEPIDHAELGIAANKGNDDLLEVVNDVLQEMEESGEKEDLFNKWLPKQ